VFKAHRLVYHSTLSSRVIKKKNSGFEFRVSMFRVPGFAFWVSDFVYAA
jgi:hypothetical protein